MHLVFTAPSLAASAHEPRRIAQVARRIGARCRNLRSLPLGMGEENALTGETRVSGTEAARFISGRNCRCL